MSFFPSTIVLLQLLSLATYMENKKSPHLMRKTAPLSGSEKHCTDGSDVM